MKKYIIVCMALVMLVSIAACSRGANESAEALNFARQRETLTMADSAPIPDAPAAAPAETSLQLHTMVTGSAANYGVWIEDTDDFSHTTQRERHVIQTAWTELETEYFDDVISDLRQIPEFVDGYVESDQLSRRGGRIFNITMRIPAASFQDVLSQVENLADVRTSSQSAEDVTDQFYDTEARLQTRRIEEERLLALIEAAENVHDLLELERRLSSTRLQIETYTAQLTNLAGRIAYSTIFVTLFDIAEEEIIPIAGPTLGERIGGAFGDSVDAIVTTGQNFVIFIAGIIIPVLIWGVVIFAAFKLIKRMVKKMRSRANHTTV